MRLETPHYFEKSFTFSVKDTDFNQEKGVISGYASTFGNVDLVQDVMVKGCFEKSLKENGGRWPVLYNHGKQVGTNLSAQEDEKGLFVVSKIFKDEDALSDAKEVWSLVKANMKAGVKMGLSIGGQIKEVEIDKKDGRLIWKILEWDIIEHSITATPCNRRAQVESRKSIIDSALKQSNLEERLKKSQEELNYYKIYCNNLLSILEKR